MSLTDDLRAQIAEMTRAGLGRPPEEAEGTKIMANIEQAIVEQAIGRLTELKPWPEGYYVDLNYHRDEIVSLMQACHVVMYSVRSDNDIELNEQAAIDLMALDRALSLLARKILWEQK